MYAGHIIVTVNFAVLSAFLQVFLLLENDMPLETRIFQENARTLLKEIGKDQELVFVGNKLMYQDLDRTEVLQGGTISMSTGRHVDNDFIPGLKTKTDF
jgi:hypothetical protein